MRGFRTGNKGGEGGVGMVVVRLKQPGNQEEKKEKKERKGREFVRGGLKEEILDKSSWGGKREEQRDHVCQRYVGG